ncbi:class I SAM-dependent methyltransferase [Pseudonocardia spinosispora]|uniref:class I SAM-dependent methyltransferase n=1 Tax=Pseudonocardia spinosispora TaxID=103441 RepID=UPI0004161ADB|nr:class I SAM-dependent methyltransferase [Pseudonocardia spinosispora]
MSTDFHWERYAGEWIEWVRTPDHDAFWVYVQQFREFLPPPGSHTLDLGCGEGRVSRELTDLGHRVTASDLSPSLLEAAERAGSAADYRLADAAALPFADDSFDRVVAYNVLMDVPDVPAAVAEVARVLAPGGEFTMSVVHPFADRCTVDDSGRFVMAGDYLTGGVFSAAETRAGLDMHWDGWSRPLHEYFDALTSAGLAVTAMREPKPERVDGPYSGLEPWRRMPLFLWLNARHRA